MSTDTIGKYGVGAKLAALNFGRRIDVWSRQRADAPWLHTHFDLDEALEEEGAGKEPGIDVPDTEAVPDDLLPLLPERSGTLVVWSRVDRLEEGRMAPNFELLRIEVEKELSRIFRHFIHDGIKLSVNNKELLPHDPLLVMDNTWADHVLTKHYAKKEDGGAADDELTHFPAEVIADEAIKIAGGGEARLMVTLYPKEVLRRRGLGGDDLAKQLRLEENLGAISFVRMNREVSYTKRPAHLSARRR